MTEKVNEIINELKELSKDDKRIKVPKSDNGWYDHTEPDSDWIQCWNSKIMNNLAYIDKILATNYQNKFCNVQQNVSKAMDL